MSESYAVLRQKFAWEMPSASWYVPRREEFLEEIIAELSSGADTGVLWVTGPNGGGLSTQLARLGEELTDRGWKPVRVSLLGRAEPGRAIGPTGMMLVTAFWLLRALPEGTHGLDNAAERVARRLTEALTVLCMIPGKRASADWVNGLGQALFLTIQRLKDPTFREQVETEPSVPSADCAELIGALAKLLGATGKVALIVDDANELDLQNNADRLITRCASFWQTLPVRAVVTYPRRLDYSRDFAVASAREPRIALRPLPEAGRADFHHEVLKRRLPDLEAPASWVAAADELAHGNTSEFLELVAGALRLARARGEQLGRQHLDSAASRRGLELKRLVSGDAALQRLVQRGDGTDLEEIAARWLGVRALMEVGEDAALRIHPALAAQLSGSEERN